MGENLMAFNPRERMLVILVVVCVVLLGGDRLAVAPLVRVWKARTLRIAELETSLEKGKMLTGREKDLEKRWQGMRDRGLPATPQEAEPLVFKSVDTWSQESGLSVTSLKPRWTQDEKNSRKVEFRLSATGSLRSAARFVYELEGASLPLKVESVEIASRDDQGRVLTLEMVFTGLVLGKAEK
jgi:Tfp pilus assembly protein PilO